MIIRVRTLALAAIVSAAFLAGWLVRPAAAAEPGAVWCAGFMAPVVRYPSKKTDETIPAMQLPPGWKPLGGGFTAEHSILSGMNQIADGAVVVACTGI
jgi:hypothetical protein